MANRNTIYVLRGLPASGKSTLARQKVEVDHAKRVNRDDLRAMLDNGKYTANNEMFVVGLEDAIIQMALSWGFDVVVDDTNLNPKKVEAFKKLAESLQANIEIITMDTDLEECIRRDALREKPVGEAKIRQMYSDFM